MPEPPNDETVYPWWAGRLSQTLRHVVEADTDYMRERARTFAVEVMADYDAWRDRRADERLDQDHALVDLEDQRRDASERSR